MTVLFLRRYEHFADNNISKDTHNQLFFIASFAKYTF
jgi:hypothetical protein